LHQLETKESVIKVTEVSLQHDEAVREAGQAKRAIKGTLNGGDDGGAQETTASSKVRLVLWVRASGLDYDSTQEGHSNLLSRLQPNYGVSFPTEDSLW
jgi:hypothetical protein